MLPDDAYTQLSRALEMRAPECDGIDLFTADRISATDAEILAPICARCDVALLCRQYAKAEKPKVGYWAGKRYHAPEPTTPKDNARQSIRQTGPKRNATAAAATKRAAWCRAHAARLRDAVARGDLEPWYLDAAAHYEAEADQHQNASRAA